jgi:hypothetical protein
MAGYQRSEPMSVAAVPALPTTPTAPAVPPPGLTAAELIRSLPEGFKAALLSELVRELSAAHGGKGVIPLRSPTDEWLGNLALPGEPAAKADRDYFELDPMHRLAVMKPYLDLDLDNTYTAEQILALTAGAGPTPQ